MGWGGSGSLEAGVGGGMDGVLQVRELDGQMDMDQLDKMQPAHQLEILWFQRCILVRPAPSAEPTCVVLKSPDALGIARQKIINDARRIKTRSSGVNYNGSRKRNLPPT